MVAQTIHACHINQQKHGELFSWKGDGVHGANGAGLVDNGTAYAMLVDKGYFTEDVREGRTIIRVTPKLVSLLDGFFASRKAE